MYKVKVSTSELKNQNILIRQTPNSSGVWKNCKFYINQNIDQPDWWFVLHGSGLKKKENIFCDPDNIVYISLEASESENKVSLNFLKQFSKLVISDKKINHKDIIYQNGITWYAGLKVTKNKNKHIFTGSNHLNYNDLTDLKIPKKKNKISVILSDKKAFKGHILRKNFIKKLLETNLINYIDIYGHGYREIPDKLDVILNYKYHLVLENNSIETYWSEKLGDAYLGYALPIYYGCKNIHNYFQDKALVNININKFDESVRVIEKVLADDIYDDRFDYIIKAREKILNQYNIFNIMSDIIYSKKNVKDRKNIILYPNEYFANNILKRLIKKIIIRE